MSDESPDNEPTWWMPADRPEPAEPEDVIELGQMRPTRPIGPVSLRSWSRRPYILAGVAVVALLAGAGAALAATNSSPPSATSSAAAATPSPSPTPSGPSRPGFHRFGPGGFGGFGFGGGLFGALHGQLVVTKPGGGYETVDVQNGQVTAVSSTSITLKSADGFTKSYTVTSSTLVDAQRDGIGSVKVGNQASVTATVSGAAVTATSINDLTLLQQGHAGFGSGQGTSGGAGPSTQTG
jgi:hypothetical protein